MRTSARRWHSGSERYWGAGEEETGARLQGLWGGLALGSAEVQDGSQGADPVRLEDGGPQQSRVVGRGPI